MKNVHVGFWRAVESFAKRKGIYAKSNCVGFIIIFGKDERTKFEDIRSTLSDPVCRRYDEAKIYHDGKWVMFEPIDTT